MKQGIIKAASIATNKALAKAIILKQKTVTYTKTKFIVTKEFMKYVTTDPMFQGVAITVGIINGAAGILSFGHQLYFSSSAPLTEEQVEALLNKINTEQTENLKVIVKNEVDQKLETWDIDHHERITEQEKQIKSLTYQRNTIVVALFAVVHSLEKSHVIIEQSDNNIHTLDYWKTDEENNLFKLKTETITKPRWKSWLGL